LCFFNHPSYILIETNEVEEIEEHIKLAIQEKKFKKFGNEERLDQFEELRNLVETISTKYINKTNETELFKNIHRWLSGDY